MPYDSSIYQGSAEHYLKGRPPYSPLLLSVLAEDLGWDASGTLLDAGCGPGVLAVQLAPGFAEVVALDPDPAMLAEGQRHARQMGRTNLTWVRDVAEHLGQRGWAPLRAATFGQSLHWMDRDVVLESVYGALEPGGSIVVVGHDEHSVSPSLANPTVPVEAVRELIRRYLGTTDPHGTAATWSSAERHEQRIAQSRFGAPREVRAPGCVVEWDEPDVVSMFLSMSYCSPHLFGDQLDDFVSELTQVLRRASPDGRFSEFPGDTVALVASK